MSMTKKVAKRNAVLKRMTPALSSKKRAKGRFSLADLPFEPAMCRSHQTCHRGPWSFFFVPPNTGSDTWRMVQTTRQKLRFMVTKLFPSCRSNSHNAGWWEELFSLASAAWFDDGQKAVEGVVSPVSYVCDTCARQYGTMKSQNCKRGHVHNIRQEPQI